jgi:hypothetical protein
MCAQFLLLVEWLSPDIALATTGWRRSDVVGASARDALSRSLDIGKRGFRRVPKSWREGEVAADCWPLTPAVWGP